jgi:hypothetical protein
VKAKYIALGISMLGLIAVIYAMPDLVRYAKIKAM